MNFIKRAGITLWARKGRTVLLVITASVVLMFVMAGLIIQNAALMSAKTATNSIGSTVTLSQNREKMMQKMQKKMSSSSADEQPTFTQPTTTIAKVKKIAALSNVASYNISTSASVNASGFNAVSTSSASSQTGMGGPFGNSSSNGSIQINGVSTTAGSANFSDGTAKMISGRGSRQAMKIKIMLSSSQN
ncbi:hypothetical protein [Weissella thailandensis]|uniref:hypothetical protein n=1 Tax=Weissella thailandensis TaxID=89061 RepID=UPI0011931DAD|nr:hypothetical protein [Weissella thailandensis]GEP74963.1 hypothetical protein WTH01_12100 [Weissella thailandensis]